MEIDKLKQYLEILVVKNLIFTLKLFRVMLFVFG